LNVHLFDSFHRKYLLKYRFDWLKDPVKIVITSEYNFSSRHETLQDLKLESCSVFDLTNRTYSTNSDFIELHADPITIENHLDSLRYIFLVWDRGNESPLICMYDIGMVQTTPIPNSVNITWPKSGILKIPLPLFA
jgi:hypothetical protein